MLDIVVVGGGEHARVVMDAVRSRPGELRLRAFTDPQDCPRAREMYGVPQLDDDALATLPKEDTALVLGVGGLGPSPVRERVVERLRPLGLRWTPVVHARAVVAESAQVREGAVVMAGAVVQPGAVVDAHVVVNTGAIIEHDVTLEPYVLIAPGAVLGGGARVGRGAVVGLGAAVRDHVVVGEGAMVGMGAVVTRSVAAGVVVVGNPARSR
ncbi:MAG: NeuD/PglB/VioB family sugar acetyltransferase [Myxococcota bacterium]